MDDLISRQAAVDALGEEPFAFGEYEQGLHDQWKSDIENINQIPSAQPERKTGRWMPVGDSGAAHFYRCSKCGYLVLGNGRKYCEDCGTKMEVEHETD